MRPRLGIYYMCDYCDLWSYTTLSKYNRKTRHYCSQSCYSNDRRENWLPSEQPTWNGGVSATEAHRRWKRKNPERMAHLKSRRYARERNAEGSHTLNEWVELKDAFNNRCANCRLKTKLTKDHIIPLSKGGTDYIKNIQPLCRSCNSKKWSHIYENPDLLSNENFE